MSTEQPGTAGTAMSSKQQHYVTSIYFTEDIYFQLEDFCHKTNRKRSYVIRQALKHFFKYLEDGGIEYGKEEKLNEAC